MSQYPPRHCYATNTLARRLAPFAAIMLIAAVFAAVNQNKNASAATSTTSIGIYAGTEVPAITADTDPNAVELGVRFTVSTPGSLTAIRFYKSTTNTGTHVGNLWAANGTKLASAVFTSESSSGWQTAQLANPVALTPGAGYTASYHTNTGHYAAKPYAFANGATLGNNTIRATAGVYEYGPGGFPTLTWHHSSYYVDALFRPTPTTVTSSPVSTPPTSASAVPATSAAPTTAAPATSRAPTPTRSSTSTPAPTTAAPATSSAPTPTHSTTTAPTPTTAPTTAPATGGFPGAGNTGYKNAACPNGRTTWGGGAIKSNTTYSCIDFPGGADVGSAGADVTNVRMYGDYFHGAAPEAKLVGVWGSGISFSYCTFAPGTTTLPVPFAQSYQYGIAADGSYNTHVGALNVDHSDFYGFGNAIDTNGSSQGAPQVFTDNWIHDAATGGDYHVDGIGTESGSGSGSYVVITHNTISSAGNTNGIAFQAGHYDHFTITGNLFSGFGYTVAILGGATNVTFTGNTFSTLFTTQWGPLYPADFANTAGSTWRGNRWSVPAGAAWGTAAHNGWFWLPNTGTGSSDTPFVSQTDYKQ